MRGLFAPKEESLKEGHYGQITLDVAKKMDNGDYMAIYKWPSGRNSFGLAAYIYAIYESIKNDLGADKCNPYYAQNSSMYIDYLIDNYSKESVNKAVEEFKKYGVELKPTVKSSWYDKKGVSQYFRITNVDENKLLNSTLNNYSVIKSKEEVDKYLNQYFKDLPAIKAAEDAEWVAKQAQSSTDGTKEESLKEDTAARHDLDILKPYLPSDFQYRQFYSVILVRKDIGTFMEALRKDGWKLISYPTATELETENNVFVGSAIFSKDNLNIYVWESESPKVCYVRLLDKSLDESKLDEAIPREVAQALKNSSGLEIKNSGGAYYRIPGSTDSKYSNLDPKTALDNSKVDYANAEFNKISKEEAFNLFKTEPQNLLLIVKDYGRNSDKAIWFDENGNRSGRVETVPLDIAPVRRDGEPIRDTKYMTPKQLINCASACY